MTKEQNQYLESIGITGALTEKVERVVAFYTEYLGVEFDDIFITEFVNMEGSRFYENLWLINNNFCYEAKLFMTEDDFDSDIIKNSVKWFAIKKTDFDIVNNITNDNSRMHLEFGLESGRDGDMKASKDNCKQLSLIFKKYIQPNYISRL